MNKKTSSSWLSALKKTFSTSKPISSSPSQIPKEKSIRNSSGSSSPEMSRFETITEATDPQAPLLESAATKIQAAFRGYLARRALKSLKALVKLQALVRGYYIRRRTQATLRCLFSLLRIQGRARRRRLVAESPSPGVIWAGRNIDRSAVRHAEYFPWHVLAGGQSTRGCNEYSTKTSEYSRSTTEIEKNGDTSKISGRSNGSSGSVCDRQPYGGIEGLSSYHPKIEKDLLSLKTEEVRRRLSPRKLANCHNNYSSLQYQPLPSSTLKTELAKPRYKNQNRIQLTSKYSHQISPPAAPNYMAFTQSAKARRCTTASKRVSSSAGSPSSPVNLQVNLHEGSFLPPIRTRRTSFPLVESDL